MCSGCISIVLILLATSLFVWFCSDDKTEADRSVPEYSQKAPNDGGEGLPEEGYYAEESVEPVEYPSLRLGGMEWTTANMGDEIEGSYCYDDAPSCENTGRLYKWYAAMRACGTGWHLPSVEEFERLKNALGNEPGRKLKATETWESDSGSDTYGFSMYATGLRDETGDYLMKGENAYFWTSTEVDGVRAFYWSLSDTKNDFVRGSDRKSVALSVRCVKDQ